MKIKTDFLLKTTAVISITFLAAILIYKFRIQDDKTKVESEFSLYNMSSPNTIFDLPKKLDEISGLTYYSDSLLACIDDEKGNIYFINRFSGEITEKYDFGKNADYEGIAIVDSLIYVLKSNGNLYEINILQDETKAKKYETMLTINNDTEGLCYDEKIGKLLIICKEKPYIGQKVKQLKGTKAVYSFDFGREDIIAEPFFTINIDEISAITGFAGKVNFLPSALCKHPQSGDYYILSSGEKLLVIIGTNFKVKHVIRLNPKLYNQPEGLCFAPDGTLYISNEAGTEQANILVFKMIK